MRFFSVITLVVLLYSQAFSQEQCGQAQYENHFRAEHPELIHEIDSMQQSIVDQEEMISGARLEKIIIPVVFHIIHDNGPENISDDQVKDALRVMNEDFNALNEELNEVVSAFQNRIGNAEIEFRLAAKDPNGNFTTGIDRIESNETYVGDNGSKLNPWPRSKYLNIWVTDVITVVGANAAAYAIRPAFANGSPSVDGIISNHRYVGTIGTANPNGSKTLTHEVGHYLDLAHTWGETNFPGCDGSATNPNDPCFGVNNCGDDDGISDTPNCLGVSNGSCNLTQTSCSNLDNVQNFMDYANCEAMFTEGQVARMRATLNSSVAQRSSLWTNSNYTATGVTALSEARYAVQSKSVCRGESVQFIDESRYNPDSWTWVITGPDTFTSSDQHPSFTFAEPGYYSVELTVTQGSNTESLLDENAIFVTDVYGAAVPFFEDFNEPKDGWISINRGLEEDKYKWQLKSDVGYDDNHSYMVYNIGNDDKNNDDLVFSGIDFRPMTTVNIDFKVAYARLNNDDNDKLSLSVSNDCGITWHQVWSAASAQLNGSKPLSSSIFKPTSQSDWESFNVSNIPLIWLGEDAMIRFTFEPGGGNQLYIDNINITGDYAMIPSLVFPENGATDRRTDEPLDWRAVPGATSYRYELSTSSTFASLTASGDNDVIDDEDSGKSDTWFESEDLEPGQTYYWRVRATVNGTNSSWSDVWSFTVAEDGVGIEAPEKGSFSIYPNPADDYITLSFASEMRNAEVRLYNIDGRLVHAATIMSISPDEAFNINTGALPAGAYFIQLREENNIHFQRFLIYR